MPYVLTHTFHKIEVLRKSNSKLCLGTIYTVPKRKFQQNLYKIPMVLNYAALSQKRKALTNFIYTVIEYSGFES